MNRHFYRHFDGDFSVPSRAYGRLDHVEIAHPRGQSLIAAFDVVDADWFDTESGYLAKTARESSGYLSGSMFPAARAFERAPLFRIEVEMACRLI